MIEKIVKDIRTIYGEEFIPLHIPFLDDTDKAHIVECIDSTFVSSVGKFVDEFEDLTAAFTGAKKAVATVNGTAALHTALKLMGVERDDEVVCQPFTFIATANAIHYCGAEPIFIDIEEEYLSLCPIKLRLFFENDTELKDGQRINKITGKRVRAVVMMHSFGMPGKVVEVYEVCKEFGVPLVEDAAESLGSYYKGVHTGVIGDIGILSYNGNKVMTTGGGGMILCKSEELGLKAKHITTTAKKAHRWAYDHDIIGFNYRLPNLNASLGVAQMKKLTNFLKKKRKVADVYSSMFSNIEGVKFFREDEDRVSNYWLNALIFDNPKLRDEFLQYSNDNGVMTRPPWGLMNEQEPYKNCFKKDVSVSKHFAERLVNIPSSVIDYEG